MNVLRQVLDPVFLGKSGGVFHQPAILVSVHCPAIVYIQVYVPHLPEGSDS